MVAETATFNTRHSIGLDLHVIQRLFAETFRGQVQRYVRALLWMAVAAVSTASLALLMRHVVNDIFVAQSLTLIWPIAGAIFLASLAKGVSDYRQTVMMAMISNSIIATLQRRIFSKMLALSVDYFAQRHSAKMINRMTANANAARNVVTKVSTSLGRDLLTVIALSVVMIIQDPLMSVAAILLGPPVILGLHRIVRRIRELSSSELQGMANVVQSTQETVQGIRVVKSFTIEEPMRVRFDKAVRDVQTRSDHIVRLRARTSPIMDTLGGALIAGLVLYAGWQTIGAGKTPGEFMAFITAFLMAYEPAKRLASAHVSLQRDIVGVEQMFRFLDQAEQEPENDDRLPLPHLEGRIEVTNLVFGYEKDKPVLNDVSIEVGVGEVVALVGPSGAGKSTLVSLIQGFHRPWQGNIEIDGIPISSVNLRSLRRNISVVSQEMVMFSGTIQENVALAMPGASTQEIEMALEAAYAMPFIRRLPKGLDTMIGERGSTLSGGQVQRLSIARALLKNAPILLLDEATSALDTESERQVQHALSTLMAGKTTLVIAHRLSTIQGADRTYLLADGRVVASGQHDDLLQSSKLYQRLFGARRDAEVERSAWGVIA